MSKVDLQGRDCGEQKLAFSVVKKLLFVKKGRFGEVLVAVKLLCLIGNGSTHQQRLQVRL